MPGIKRIRGAITAEQAKVTFSEVDKKFYELQLADCRKKLQRLTQAVHDYEIRNATLQKAYDQLDEDKADVIAYLKKTLNVKTEENTELKEKVRSLEELRVNETTEFNETVNELERKFTLTKDQLTSENKLLAGKLNTLEEFRAIRQKLVNKFERQEQEFEEQEMKYKRIIHDTEKQLIIGKDKLKKEMEERLLQLAQEFQDASEMRIAASTHRVIRENIALNNQLDSLLITQAKVTEQNEKFKADERASYCAMEVAEKKRDKAMNNSIVQLKVIDQLNAACEDVRKQKAFYEKKQFHTENMKAKIQRLSKTNEKLSLKVHVLEQQLHAILGQQNKSVVETAKLLRERQKCKNILQKSAFAVQAAIKLDDWTTLDPSREILDIEIVLKRILGVINQYRDTARAESMESLISLGDIYAKGDLGIDVKPVPSKKSQALYEAAGAVKTASLLSFEDRRSSISVSSRLSSSKESIKTMPSIELVPVDEDISLPKPKESVASFTVTSLHSSATPSTESEESESDLTDVSKLLALSRVEMQKSLMQDLALSQLSIKKLSGMPLSKSKSRLSKGSQKSILSEKGGSDDVEGEHHKTMSEEDGSEHVQEEGASTHDASELETVEQDDDEDNKKKETSSE